MVPAVSLPLLFVPITLAAYVGLPPETGNSAAGLINFMRNVGSSIGTCFDAAARSAAAMRYLVGRR
jgi:hypothetical protein